jgi:peptidoglycan hydrolase-like amidase
VIFAATAAPGAGAANDQAWQWQTGVVRFEPQPGATVAVDGVGEFRGTVELRRVGAATAVINELPLEEYLLGLAEVPSTWPAAALEAQAIAARTFAVRSALTPSSGAHRAAGADICATESCQVYDGVDRERRDVGGAWAAAVRATANRLLLDRGAPILAKYASSNGGQSEDGGYPYLRATPDPDDAAISPYAAWQSVIPLADVERALPGAGHLVEVNRAGDDVALLREQPDGTTVAEGLAPLDFRRALNRSVPTPAAVPVTVPSHRLVDRSEKRAVVLNG